jgi:HTH-type transcriptional regulator / antitoxin HigA
MKVINRHRMRDFWENHERSEQSLRAWHQFVSSYDVQSPDALQGIFPNAIVHEDLTAFDIGGSAYFLITTIDYDRATIFVRDVLLHSDFRGDSWKSLAASQSQEGETEARSYIDLVQEFELRPIRDVEGLQHASTVTDGLLSIPNRSPDEQDYLDVLALIIKDYEDRNVPVPPVPAADVLRLLIMEHRLSQAELIPLLGGKNKVAELLKGKRSLELRQVTRASRYFKLPAEIFMDPDDLDDKS